MLANSCHGGDQAAAGCPAVISSHPVTAVAAAANDVIETLIARVVGRLFDTSRDHAKYRQNDYPSAASFTVLDIYSCLFLRH